MPTLNPGPGVEITQEKVIAAASLTEGASHDEYMTHLVDVEFADAKIKGDVDGIVEIDAITGNKVTLKGRVLSSGNAMSNLKTEINKPVQVIARGY